MTLTIRRLPTQDLLGALADGWADFRAAPTQLFFLCILYPVAALVFGRLATGDGLFPLLYPVASGFALIGPLSAVGLYEISRRREQQLDANWRHVFDVVREPGFASVALLGAGLVMLFLAWVALVFSIPMALDRAVLPVEAVRTSLSAVTTICASWSSGASSWACCSSSAPSPPSSAWPS